MSTTLGGALSDARLDDERMVRPEVLVVVLGEVRFGECREIGECRVDAGEIDAKAVSFQA